MKKTTKTLIIAVTAVALLVGVFLLVYFLLPQQDDPKDIENINPPSSDVLSEDDVPAEYPLVTHIPAEIKQIEVENETGSYTLLSETPTVEVTASDGTASTATESTIYTLVGYEDRELLLGSPDALANDAAAVTAKKIVGDESKKSDFGFDEPRATVTTTFTTGDKSTVIVGADAPADQGTYLMIGGDKNIYLVNSDSADGFMIGAMGMLSTTIGSAATDDSGNVFTKMVFGGKLFGGDVTFEYSNNDAFSETYRITSPDNVLANEEVVTYMINNVRSLTATEVVAVNADEEKLKEYGLEDPYVTVDAEYPDLKVSYKASKPDSEGVFYMQSDGIIYKMSTDSVPWVLHNYDECIVKSIMKPKYNSVTGISVEADGKTYSFDVKTVSTKDENDVESSSTTVSCNGTAIDEEKFSVYYQNLTSAERAGGIEAVKDGKPTLTVKMTFSNGEESTAEYYAGENRKCPVKINGTLGSFAYETYVTKIIEDTAKIAANQSVESVY